MYFLEDKSIELYTKGMGLQQAKHWINNSLV